MNPLEHVKRLALWNHRHRISMIQGNSKISEMNFGESPVLMVYQKPEALSMTNNTLHNEYLHVTLSEPKGILRHIL